MAFQSEYRETTTGYGFRNNQRIAADGTKRAEQRTQEMVRDEKAQQQVINAYTTVANAQLQADKAKANANLEAIKGIASAAGTLANGVSRISQITKRAREEEEREQREAQEIADKNSLLFSEGGSVVVGQDGKAIAQPAPSATGFTNESDQDLQATSIIAGAEDAANNADEVEQINQESADQTTARAAGRTNIYQAALGVGAYVQDGMADPNKYIRLRDGRVIRATDAANAQEQLEVATALAREHASINGITSGEATVRTYVPAALDAIQRGVNGVNRERREAIQEERAQVHVDTALAGIAAGEPLDVVWQRATAGVRSSGAVNSQKEANDIVAQSLINHAVATNDLELLERLEATPKFTTPDGKSGPSVGSTYGTAIAEAKDKINRQMYSNGQRERTLDTQAVSDLKQAHAASLIEAGANAEQTRALNNSYQQQLEEMSRAGNVSAQRELNNLNTSPGWQNYSPANYHSFREQVQAGQTLDQEVLNNAVQSGAITGEEYKSLMDMPGATTDSQFIARTGGKEGNKARENSVKSAVGVVLKGEIGSFPPAVQSGLTQQVSTDINKRLNSDIKQFLKEYPAATVANVNDFTQKWLKENVPELLKGVKVNSKTGQLEGYNFINSQPIDTSVSIVKRPSDMKEIEDYSRVPTSQLGQYRANMSPKEDFIISQNQLETGIRQLQQGYVSDPIIKQRAKELNRTPQQFVREQAQAYGYDLEAPAVPELPTAPSGEPTDISSGAQHLNRVLGVPAKGAAYLAANIQQESSWNGRRSWPGVYNPSTGAMDGTSRNGGLVSWASWADDPARLGKIERYLGKPIEQATHAEQLQAMMWEMKTAYPNEYRVFMNPNATDRQLRRASYQYWGYGHEGARFGPYLTKARSAVGA